MTGLPTAVSFLTRVRIRRGGWDPGDVARSVPWFPMVGALVGLTVAGAYAGGRAVLPPVVAAVAAVALGVALTGAFHEDGLADTMDALGAWSRKDALRILKDPAHGTFGVSAIVLSVALRASAVASLGPWAALGVLPAAHALSRAAAVIVLRVVPAGPVPGLGATYSSQVTRRATLVAAGAGLAVAGAGLGLWAVVATIASGAAVAALTRVLLRRIGSITGDAVGAVQQVVEVAVLLTAAAATHAAGPALAWWR